MQFWRAANDKDKSPTWLLANACNYIPSQTRNNVHEEILNMTITKPRYQDTGHFTVDAHTNQHQVESGKTLLPLTPVRTGNSHKNFPLSREYTYN